MRQLRRDVLVLVSVLLVVTGGSMAGAQTADPAAPVDNSEVLAKIVVPESEATLGTRLSHWLAESYAREPELTMAIAVLGIALPAVSLGALVVAWFARRRDARADAEARARSARPWRDATHIMPGNGQAAARVNALFQMEDDIAAELPISGNMVRIGRHQENDIRLASKTVHRYHAVMHVTPEQDYVITDLSGEAGNGVIVNGRRVEQATLKGDDLIELGETRLRFRLRQDAPVEHSHEGRPS